MSAEYNDALTLPAACSNMWAQVLMQAITDATSAPKSGTTNATTRLRLVVEARDYITVPNRGFNEVCHLAGLDPVSVRERAIKLIAASPNRIRRYGRKAVRDGWRLL